MIKHIVMWKLKEPSEGECRGANALQVKAWLDTCSDLVPGIRRFEVVVAQEDMEATCDVLLIAEFTSPEALAAYNGHPDHLALKARVAPLRESRQCFDYVFDVNLPLQHAGAAALAVRP
ncbi:Dabb family protein [Pseudoduganella sp. UC29_106]|uniref:Dabb family protein n=1 Tax=Pseudoduganella sp. UC29_106 TaxID=3374553 RepID=UPI0037572BB4